MPIKISKRLLYSLILLLVWLSFVVEGSHALFTSTAQLTGNAITTGTSLLQVSNSQDPNPTNFAVAQPGFQYNLVPGQTADNFFTLKNNSDSPVDMDIQVLARFAARPAGQSGVTISFTPVDATGAATGAKVTNTLEDLVGSPSAIGSTLVKGQAQRYKVSVTLSSSFDGQNISTNYDLSFIGTQHIAS